MIRRSLAVGALVLAGTVLGLRGRVRRDVPFSRLRARGRVGSDFLDRVEAIGGSDGHAPTGMVDDLDELAGPDFDPRQVDDAIRAFYEDTADCEMDIRPGWHPALDRVAPLYHRVARRGGQFALPVAPQVGADGLTSRVVPVRVGVDGRAGARAWVRRYPDGDAMYVAVYTTYARADQSYLNVAFPLPGGNLTGVLRAEHLGEGGLVLTSEGSGDEGLYLVQDGVGVRLPLSETLRVWHDPVDGPDSPFDADSVGAERNGGRETVFARHDVWCSGVRLFALDYNITRPADE